MKFNINREVLLPALQIVGGVVERRQTLPVLSNLLVSVAPDHMRLLGSDVEVELAVTIAGEFGVSGDLTLPARKLWDICRALPEGVEMRFSVEGGRVLLSSGKSRFTLATWPPRDFPQTKPSDTEVTIRIQQGALKNLLDKTAFAMAQQDVRYYLNGLLLEAQQDRLRAVATDGHRLALCDADVAVSASEDKQLIVPRKGVLELVRLLQDDETEVEIRLSQNHIRIELNNLVFTSKMIDGKFPDYTRVIPEQNDTPVIVDRELLKQSLIRASILSNEKYRGVRILLTQDKLRALTHNPEQEEAEEEIAVQYAGDDLEIGFNVSYLLDAISIIRTDEISITILDPNSSCLLSPRDESKCKYVVMPMRL